MVSVIKGFEVGKIYMPRVAHTTKTFEDLLLAIRDKSLKITGAQGGGYPGGWEDRSALRSACGLGIQELERLQRRTSTDLRRD